MPAVVTSFILFILIVATGAVEVNKALCLWLATGERLLLDGSAWALTGRQRRVAIRCQGRYLITSGVVRLPIF